MGMPGAALDACCLIDLLATGHEEAILRAAGYDWNLPSAVESEIQHIRGYDPAQPGQFLKLPVYLSPLKASGLLNPCSPANQVETDRFVHYASLFRSDGEAMGIAIAEQRGWTFATDDRKAIRVARQAGLRVVSSPELLKKWADATQPDPAVLADVLERIQVLAQFKPHSSMPEYAWWIAALTSANP
jgi:hypothetical protein